MSVQKFIAGYVSGLVALAIELAIFAFSLFSAFWGGIFPESASNLSSMLSTMTTITFFINLGVGITGALNLANMRWLAFGFLAGILTDLAIFGGILSSVAPQIVSGLWGEFLTALIPIVIFFILYLVYEKLQENQPQEYYCPN